MNNVAWLIEYPNHNYLAIIDYNFRWTLDVNEALRFFSQKQAEDVLKAVLALNPAALWILEAGKATEHTFFNEKQIQVMNSLLELEKNVAADANQISPKNLVEKMTDAVGAPIKAAGTVIDSVEAGVKEFTDTAKKV